jgi:hypothetical protein
MVDGELLDRVDQIGQKLRGNTRPFGGLQVCESEEQGLC